MSAGISRKKKKGEDEEEEPDLTGWMVTFADLLSLMLTFFVLLFSMNTLDDQVVKEMFSSFTGGTGVLSFSDRFPMSKPKFDTSVMTRTITLRDFIQFIEKERKSEIKTNPKTKQHLRLTVGNLLLDEIRLKKRGSDFVFSFPSQKLFEPGKTKLDPSMLPALDRIGEILQYSQSDILVEGHTDDIPFYSKRFGSNWELSLARANAVMNYMIKNTPIGADRIKALGYGMTRPIVAPVNEIYRARNRRVEIVIRQAPEN